MEDNKRRFLVALAATAVATTIIHRGQFQLDWFLVWVLYLGQISLSSFVYGLRPSGLPAEAAAEPEAEVPPQRKDPVWFWGVRLLTVPALVGLAEWALRIEATWLAVLVQAGVWLYLVLVILFAVGEILVRLFQTVEGAGFFDAIFKILDRIYAEPIEVPLAKHEELEMVREPSPWAVVYPAVFIDSLRALLVGLVLGWLYSTFFSFETVLVSGYPYWPFLVVPLLVVTVTVVGSYSINEWNRRHTRFVWFTKTFWVVAIRIGRFFTKEVELNPSATVRQHEARAVTFGGTWRLGQARKESVNLLWQAYAWFLWWFLRCGDLYLLTFVFGGMDFMPGCEYVKGAAVAVRHIAGLGRLGGEFTEWQFKRLWDERLKEEIGTTEADLGVIIEAFSALVPTTPERADLMRVADPRHYDPVNGNRLTSWLLEAEAGLPPAALVRLPGFRVEE